MLNRFFSGFLDTAALVGTLLATSILVTPAAAQMRGAGVSTGTIGVHPGVAVGGSARSGVRSGAGFIGGAGRSHPEHSFGRSAVLLGYPYYYSDYGDEVEAPAQPQIVVVPAGALEQPAPPAPPFEPLLIEWQGDHYQRMSLSEKSPGGEPSTPAFAAKSAVLAPAPAARRSQRKVNAPASHQLTRELPPAVLVFHDGRTEEVTSYTIMSGTIYSKADYWTTGSWTRKIQIADLDVPATLKLNHEHGLNFMFPAGPNEVVTRP